MVLKVGEGDRIQGLAVHDGRVHPLEDCCLGLSQVQESEPEFLNFYGAQESIPLIYEKNMMSKISCQTPFKGGGGGALRILYVGM